jgi:D-alanyl-D-alanine carboxypeptidase/D-alanyl-D-alanine-endopeptidase (penicillin-binding protein 4)
MLKKSALSLLLMTAPLAAAPRVAKHIEAVLQSARDTARSAWGIRVVELSTGKVIYNLNGDHWFVPASNTKLFSTALALRRLGADFRFSTTIRAIGGPDPSGVVRGDLLVVGSGDPTLSSRSIPYRKDDPQRWGANPLEPIEELAEQVAKAGVRAVDGAVVGDDTLYVWEPYPDGWGADDPLWEYGAPVSALTINDNCFRLRLTPGKRGDDPAFLALTPSLEHFIIHNLVKTGKQQRVRVSRELGSRELVVRGSLAAESAAYEALLALDDPALYAARALTAALRDRGINVSGEPKARHRTEDQAYKTPEGRELAIRTSPPLLETLRIVNKVSQNLGAELVLRAAGYARTGVGTRQAAIKELEAFLAEAKVGKGGYSFEDGSGLSRLNLISPEALTQLLVYMHGTPDREAWLSLLPVGGEDGTLGTRFKGAAKGRMVRAKTGTLSHVSALSGYLESRTRGRLAFSIMVNNYNAPSTEIRAAIDKIALLLVEW